MKKKKPILTCRNLAVGYGQKKVLRQLNLKIYPGEFLSLLGPNGVGKTTLLRTLSRHLPAITGEIRLFKKTLAAISAPDLARIMSVVLTTKTVPPLFKVYDFVAMGRYPYTAWTGRLTPKDDAAVTEALALVRAEHLAFRDLTTLSDGEKQKVFIARALAQEPAVILLDEPTVHLDLKHRMEIMTILQGLCRDKGISVVASLHDLEVAAKVSDRVALIQGDSIIALGAPEDVLAEGTISDLYEFSNACFSRMLGNIEIHSRKDRARVFVAGGMGSSAVLLRLLAKRGYQISCGMLMKNDIDTYVAQSLGAQCLVQEELGPVSSDLLDRALAEMKACDLVVDTGFEVNSLTGPPGYLKPGPGPGQAALFLAHQGCPDRRAVFGEQGQIQWCPGKPPLWPSWTR